MVTLRPPFRAENMEGLYNRVIKGQFNKISDRFSNDLTEIIKLLIQVQPEMRPTCGKKNYLKLFRPNFKTSYHSKAT
jgi:NIMA (never in mitosis gene a)-related kinase